MNRRPARCRPVLVKYSYWLAACARGAGHDSCSVTIRAEEDVAVRGVCASTQAGFGRFGGRARACAPRRARERETEWTMMITRSQIVGGQISPKTRLDEANTERARLELIVAISLWSFRADARGETLRGTASRKKLTMDEPRPTTCQSGKATGFHPNLASRREQNVETDVACEREMCC